MATATTKLSPKATYVERGYGQVEPNHLSAQVTGQIYAQLPLDASIEVLENGMFAKYDYENGKVNFTGEGEWMLVYNTVKLYEDGLGDHDYAMKNVTYDEKAPVLPATTTVVPRLLKTNVGDIFTTNTIVAEALKVGDELAPGADGYLATAGEDAAMKWVVVKVYTMPDGQKGVKIMRVA
jgi:hypothetical protein